MFVNDKFIVRAMKLYMKYDDMYSGYLRFCGYAYNGVLSQYCDLESASKYIIFKKQLIDLWSLIKLEEPSTTEYISAIKLKLNVLELDHILDEIEEEASTLSKMLNDENPNNAVRYFNQHKFTVYGTFCLFLIVRKYTNYTLVGRWGESLGSIDRFFISSIQSRLEDNVTLVILADGYGQMFMSEISFLEGNRLDKLNQFVDSEDTL
jgi:hypothetical protein